MARLKFTCPECGEEGLLLAEVQIIEHFMLEELDSDSEVMDMTDPCGDEGLFDDCITLAIKCVCGYVLQDKKGNMVRDIKNWKQIEGLSKLTKKELEEEC